LFNIRLDNTIEIDLLALNTWMEMLLLNLTIWESEYCGDLTLI